LTSVAVAPRNLGILVSEENKWITEISNILITFQWYTKYINSSKTYKIIHRAVLLTGKINVDAYKAALKYNNR
jgi:hypothetical protein